MTVAISTGSDGPFVGNGSTTVFPFTFKAMSTAEVGVYVDGVRTTGGFTVTLGGSAGGTVTFSTAPASGRGIFIKSEPSFLQGVTLANNGAFLPTVIEQTIDRLTVQDIALQDEVSRAIVVAPGQTPPSYADLAATFKGNPGGDVSAVGAFEILSNLAIPTGVDAIWTSEYRVGSGKGGGRYLRWKAPLAALPAVGTGENAWWATDKNGGRFYPAIEAFHFNQCGAYTNGLADYNAASDDYPAFLALKSYLLWAGNVWSASYTNAPVVQMPLGIGYSSDTWVFDFATVHLRGAPGTQNGSAGYSLKFAPGKTGITIKLKGVGSTFYGIDLWSTGLGGVTTADGWHMRAASQLIDCSAWNFSQDGVNALASVGGSGDGQGNNNLFRVLGGNYHHNGRDGIHPQGGDANVYDIRDVNLTANGGWGFGGNEFLGGLVLNCHTDVNGVKGLAGTTFAPNTGTSMCSYSGNRYQRIRGQEVGASTNAPSGTATHNAYWRYMLPGGVDTIYPAWVSGMLVIDGGPYLAAQASSHTLFIACYSEGTQAASYFDNNTFAIGGLHAAGIIGAHLDMADGSIFCAQGIGTRVVNLDSSATTARFGTPNNPGSTLMAYGRSALGTVDYAWNMDAEGNNYHDYGASGGPTATRYVTGAGTTLNFGRSVAQPHKDVFGEVFLGSLGNSARAMTMAGAAPTGPHAKGEIVWNDYSLATTPEYWRCTVSGNPGTWVAH